MQKKQAGVISWNPASGKYELKTRKGLILARSRRLGHLEWLVKEQRSARVLVHKINEVEIVSRDPSEPTVHIIDNQTQLPIDLGLTLEERFEATEDLVNMVINGTAKSVLIAGEGGVGKTHLVLEALKNAGKVNVKDAMPTIADLEASTISVEDDEMKMEEKIRLSMDRPRGDYIVVKGHSSAAGLFRTLWENRKELIVFDDCDNIWRDGTSLMLLKSAIDSYEERWIDWNVERTFVSDLPKSFKFEGSVIFITNRQLSSLDEAVRTRCFKIDVSMTKEQRIERIRSQLYHVMKDNPEVTDQVREESLQLMVDNLHIIKSVNFRALQNVISIRIDPLMKNKDWKKLGKFALLVE